MNILDQHLEHITALLKNSGIGPEQQTVLRQTVARYMQEAQAEGEARGYRSGYIAGWTDAPTGLDRREDTLLLPVESLGLSVRALNCLTQAGCLRVADVVRLPEEKIYAMRNLGKRTADEIARALHRQKLYHTPWDTWIVR